MDKRYILGIDTSNYKTSVAVTDENQSIICDVRKFLEVKQGEKGLRQSDALFQHVKNLPVLMEEVRAIVLRSAEIRWSHQCSCIFFETKTFGRIIYACLFGRRKLCENYSRCLMRTFIWVFTSGRTYRSSQSLFRT